MFLDVCIYVDICIYDRRPFLGASKGSLFGRTLRGRERQHEEVCLPGLIAYEVEDVEAPPILSAALQQRHRDIARISSCLVTNKGTYIYIYIYIYMNII